ncbi:MAG: hypothetical protein RL358_1821, partial [Pseudomonadota bacterium]
IGSISLIFIGFSGVGSTLAKRNWRCSFICDSGALIAATLFLPRLTRDAAPLAGLLVLLSFAALLRPFDTQLAIYNAATQAALQGKNVAVPCDFRASDERYQFLLPHTQLTAYHENLHLPITKIYISPCRN